VAIGYFVAFFICVGVGTTGPEAANVWLPAPLADSSIFCPVPNDCKVTYNLDITGMTGFHQMLYVYASILRPMDYVLNQPAAINQAISWEQVFWLEASAVNTYGDTIVLAQNLSHVASFHCAPKAMECNGALVFGQSFLEHPTYQIRTTWISPWDAFIAAGIPVSHLTGYYPVGLVMAAGTLNPGYTHFQMAGKYTFFTLSLIMNLVWIWFLCKGKGSTDPASGKRLPFSSDQIWVSVLAFLLMWYNDPTFAVTVVKPSFIASGFYATDAVTFLAVLMLYWLVTFDSSRSSSGTSLGSTRDGASASCARKLQLGKVASAMLFWVPKIIWITISWLLVLSYTIVLRSAFLSDPAFDLFETFPFMKQYFVTFIAAWGGIYAIYLGLLLLRSLCKCKQITPSGRCVLGVTVVSIIALLCGFFLNGAVTVNGLDSSAVFMTTCGAANCYVWFLMIAYLPGIVPDAADLAENGTDASGREYLSGDLVLRPTQHVETQTETSWLHASPSQVDAADMGTVSLAITSSDNHMLEAVSLEPDLSESEAWR
jgi:hypothetical protein